MVQVLRLEWSGALSHTQWIALRDRLDAMLQALRAERGIVPPFLYCPKCKTRHRAASPRVSVRALILALRRFGIGSADAVRELEKSWKRYRGQQRLDLQPPQAARPEPPRPGRTDGAT